MQIEEFRITSFRSILDTGWCKMSPDGVTVLVGQNESGKTSILQALAVGLGGRDITENDVRINEPLPEIHLKFSTSSVEFESAILPLLRDYVTAQAPVVYDFLSDNNWRFVQKTSFTIRSGEYDSLRTIDDENLAVNLERNAHDIAVTLGASEAGETGSDSSTDASTRKRGVLTPIGLWSVLSNLVPDITLFQQSSGLLPDKIDISDDNTIGGNGALGAANYLLVAKLKLDDLVKSDLRTRDSLLKKANELVTRDFSVFWRQTIGQQTKLQLECALERYGPEESAKVGKPYLVFWISDGLRKLYPQQRSAGVRWFVSFYLQLKATEMSGRKRIFLLDEPGTNLHSKAQEDVLRLINQLSREIAIVYSTHSPHMIEYDKLYRVRGVQREDSSDDSPTTVLDAHRLGAASIDTLSPILALMGVDLSHQQVVRKSNNVILEEMSAFYYLTAIWELTTEQTPAFFLAATGASNTVSLAYLFVGWGLDFIVALDDDQMGRGIYNTLKRNLFGDDEALARERLLKFRDLRGIEDLFSKTDFRKLVLNGEGEDYEVANSEYMKTSGRSKIVVAFEFLRSVRQKKIRWDDLDQNSRQAATQLKESIVRLLTPQPAAQK